jgi:hypothetical protein
LEILTKKKKEQLVRKSSHKNGMTLYSLKKKTQMTKKGAEAINFF